jgi:uncharacterized cupredoxin-like copper-binding protein
MDKKRWLLLLPAIAGVLLLAALAGACGGEDEDGAEPTAGATEPANGAAGAAIDVSLTEFEVALSSGTGAAGAVTFDVSNDGTIPHDFKVIRTDLDAADLPVDSSAFTVDETQVDVVTASETLDVGQSEEVTVDLEAGAYVLICNIATHYEAGMHAAFAVQ